MSLKELLNKHRTEIKELQQKCKHSDLSLYYDKSVIGAGSSSASVHIYCKNCGLKKIIFRKPEELATPIVMTLEKQEGFRDQRLNILCNEHELS